MKLNLSWGLLLILAGCQMTQPLTPIDRDGQNTTNKTTSPSTTINTQTGKTNSQLDSSKISNSVSPQEQQDLWRRISMQFSLEIPQDEKVDYYRKWFIKHPKHLETVAQRATPFLYLITEQIEQRGFPLELALLPIVESSFDVKAYSNGKAVGLWQFLSETGKRYGLEQDFWYDGRRDVYESTEAALNYLSYLNERFDGNWYHTIAAYNSGGGRVSSAIRKNHRIGKPTDFFSLKLPKETSSYVPKLLALADVIANKEKYHINIPAIPNHPYLKLIDPKEQLDLNIAAHYAGINYKELLSYNPGYKHWATSPTGAQRLLLPISSIDRFTQTLNENRGKGIRYTRYKVKHGDSLSVIAQRHNITSILIKKTNHLKNNIIRIGQNLFIPSIRNVNDPTNQQIAALTQPSSGTAPAKQVTHTVQPGESLWRIAQKYKVSYKTIASWNNISPTRTLKVGQRLIVKQLEANGESTANVVSYRVQTGDTISEIAQKYHIKSDDIVKWNNLGDDEMIRVGQMLTIYLSTLDNTGEKA